MSGAPTLIAEPLTAAGFAPFGELVAFDPAKARRVNDGGAWRCDTLAALAPDAGGGKATLAIYRAKAASLPLRLGLLECHPHSSQTFVSLSAQRFLIVVASPDSSASPDLASLKAFIGTAGQGVNYRRGTWHAPITALDAPGDFTMLIWERGSPEDCLLNKLAAPILVAAGASP